MNSIRHDRLHRRSFTRSRVALRRPSEAADETTPCMTIHVRGNHPGDLFAKIGRDSRRSLVVHQRRTTDFPATPLARPVLSVPFFSRPAGQPEGRSLSCTRAARSCAMHTAEMGIRRRLPKTLFFMQSRVSVRTPTPRYALLPPKPARIYRRGLAPSKITCGKNDILLQASPVSEIALSRNTCLFDAAQSRCAYQLLERNRKGIIGKQ